jgi:hypothetical protein
MLLAQLLPELAADIVAALAGLDRDNFPKSRKVSAKWVFERLC